MKVLITGGFGYVGGRLGQHLVWHGHEVILGSRIRHPSPQWLPQAATVEVPWGSPAALDDICTGVDAIIHAAGLNAQDCFADPVAALNFNGVATGHLLQAAVRQGVKRFIHISTAHVYASPLGGRISEETPLTSLHPYATSHRAGEDLVRHAHQRSQIEGVVVRLSNAFGAPAHQDANCWMLLVNDLCRQAVQSQKLVLRTSGLQQRDFVPLEDVAQALRHLLELQREACGDGLFNIGGCSLSVWEMTQRIAERCQAVLGLKPEILRPEPAPGEQLATIQYECRKLQSTGVQLSGDAEREIDATLRMCAQVWG